MWAPLGNIWVILGDKELARLPAVRPFIHGICPHSAVFPATAICHPALRHAQVGLNCSKLIIYSRPRGNLCFKISILAMFLCNVSNTTNKFLLFTMTVSQIGSWIVKDRTGEVQGGIWMWSAFVTFLCKTVPQDIMNKMTAASMCVIRQACLAYKTCKHTVATKGNSATISVRVSPSSLFVLFNFKKHVWSHIIQFKYMFYKVW